MGLLSMLRIGDRPPRPAAVTALHPEPPSQHGEPREPARDVRRAGRRARRPRSSNNFVISGVKLTNFQIVNNVLHAAGHRHRHAGRPAVHDQHHQLRPATDAGQPGDAGGRVLGPPPRAGPHPPELLGLHVDTSPICLDITATEGGGLLGDLLCGLAGGGLVGTGIPTIPTAGQLTDLLGGLTDILNGALNAGPAQAGGGGERVGLHRPVRGPRPDARPARPQPAGPERLAGQLRGGPVRGLRQRHAERRAARQPAVRPRPARRSST